jgi:hypothetical protein
MAVTHLIDSNDNDRTIPAVGDTVRVKARDGLFVVLRVDERSGIADVLSCDSRPGTDSRLRTVDSGVPLDLISPAADYLPELFRWYVEEAPECKPDGTDG